MFVNLLSFNVLGVCPNNWIHMQGSCYKFSYKALNWNAAKSACETLGSKLVVINSQAEQRAIISKITGSQLTWIGLHRDPKDKSRWLWVDGTRPTYTNWNPREPSSVGEECGHLWPNYGWKWNDWTCTNSLPYVCETPIGVCPNNWLHMQGSCYKFISQAVNWNAAKSACETLGSKLVVINSQAELQALASKITGGQTTWIGFYRDPKDKSRWLWVDGSRSTYTHWRSKEPNNVREECAEMYSKRYGWEWNDGSCSNSRPYFCEILLVRSYKCECPDPGLSLSSDSKKCQDINECAVSNGGCSHKCVNTAGSYKCECPDPGLSLSSDGRKCQRYVSEPILQ
ncbi:hypothetical protein OS493_040151 [Desmophyllum pertusum]|uniref:Uncharacterized protein n=1 Tax=Desmophyllum pertusum TaxID=174260 RepID=A0A9X0D0V5_9CNID|nr:hypothetical protein OS493_040151 [Desmophyllum pertusum]